MVRVQVCLVVALAVCGCKMPKARARKGGDQAMLGKVQVYIDCISEHSWELFRYADRYRSIVAGKPSVTEADLLMFPTPDPKTCFEGIAEVRTSEPRLPELEADGDAFLTTVQSIHQLTVAGHARLDPTSSLYDPKKALELHPLLMAAFAKFDKVQAALFDRAFQLNRELNLRQLAAREKAEGRKLAVIADYLATNAEALVPLTAIPADALDRLDLPTFEQRLRAVEVSIEELSSYRLAHPKEAETWDTIVTLLDGANRYVAAAKQLAHRARNKIPYTDAERMLIATNNEASVIGAPASVIQAYNRLVAML